VHYARDGDVRLAYRVFGMSGASGAGQPHGPHLSSGSGLTFESLTPQRLKHLPEEVDVY
jgi:hypothetical protein